MPLLMVDLSYLGFSWCWCQVKGQFSGADFSGGLSAECVEGTQDHHRRNKSRRYHTWVWMYCSLLS